jgi:hypothetical protein
MGNAVGAVARQRVVFEYLVDEGLEIHNFLWVPSQ